jgi:hypothetical protein
MAKGKKVTAYADTRGVVNKGIEAKGVDWKTSSGRPTHEMDYFDCPFTLDIELEDFSKEFLIKLMHIWTKWYMTMPMLWWEKVREKFGQEPANEMMVDCWEELAQRGMQWYVPLLGPKYKTIEDIKTLQDATKLALLPPDGGLERTLFKATMEWENENHAVATIDHCVLLEKFEAEGATDGIEAICQHSEVRGTEAYFTNPCTRVTGVKVPPRKNLKPGDPVNCIWDYRMCDKPQPRGKDRREVGQKPNADWSERPSKLRS